MASRDLHNNIHVKRGISPAAAVADNTPFVSQIIDMAGYESAEFVILTGALADADATFTVLVEDGAAANLSDAAAVADSQLLGTEAQAGFTFADDDKAFKIGYVGGKRYARVTVTPANNTGNAFVAGVWILGNPRSAPTSNPPA
jgi:hypothetical protein